MSPERVGLIATRAPARGVVRTPRSLDRWFDAGVLFKGAEGLLEIACGLLLALDRNVLQSLAFRLTAKDLLHDPDDRIAGLLRQFALDLGSTGHTFATVYLVAHGAVKVVLAVALLRHQRWAYPFGVTTLLLLAGYQLYRFSHTHSPLLPVLSAIDVAIAWLVWREGRMRGASGAQPA